MRGFIRDLKFLFLSLFCFILLLVSISFISTAIINIKGMPAATLNYFQITLFLLIVLIFYTFITWLKIGRDPVYVPVARYEPPENISSSFAYYLYNEMVDFKTMLCIILDLAIKDCIEIKIKGKGLSSKIYLTRKKKYQWDLPFLPKEEQLVFDRLLDYKEPCPLDESAANRLEAIRKLIENHFIIRRNKYIVGNEIYVIPAILITIALGVIPALYSSNMLAVLINVCFIIFFVICTGIVHDPRKKIIAGIINTIIFIIAGFLDKHIHYAGFSYTQFFFLIGIWITAFYITLIRNVTPLGRKTFEYLNGFKEYIKVAEINRVDVSDPTDKERIFCKYLPYAFAMDLRNQWMENNFSILSKVTANQAMSFVDKIDILSHQLEGIIKRRH